MKHELPVILSAGIFESIRRYPSAEVSRVRQVETFELEYYFEDGGISVIDGQEYPIRRGNILIARPGNIRYSHLHFTCRFLHFLVNDQNLAAALENLPPVFPAPDPRKTENMFIDIIARFFSGDPFDNLTAAAELILLLRQLSEQGEDPGTLVKAQRFIETNCGSNLTAQDIADACSISVSWLYKLFRDAMDTTPGEYLQRCRLSAAKEMLVNTSLSLSEIALRCGFNSQSYFSDCFRRSVGIPPREFRKNSAYLL